MSDAAQEHLQAVKAAQAQGQELGAAIEQLKAEIEKCAAVIPALDTAIEAAQTAIGAAENTESSTNATVSTGEAHVAATRASGHGTLALAVDAKENSYSAYLTATALLATLQTVGAALTEAREAAAKPLAATDAQAEEASGYIAMVNGSLEAADSQITQAINI